jgi:hypothetical protein
MSQTLTHTSPQYQTGYRTEEVIKRLDFLGQAFRAIFPKIRHVCLMIRKIPKRHPGKAGSRRPDEMGT